MARVIKYTKAFKKQLKKRRQDPKWRSIFKSSLPQELDDQKRSPWKYIIQCLIEDKTIPDYFYPHTLEGWFPVNKIDNLNRDFFVLCHD